MKIKYGSRGATYCDTNREEEFWSSSYYWWLQLVSCGWIMFFFDKIVFSSIFVYWQKCFLPIHQVEPCENLTFKMCIFSWFKLNLLSPTGGSSHPGMFSKKAVRNFLQTWLENVFDRVLFYYNSSTKLSLKQLYQKSTTQPMFFVIFEK